MPRLAPAILAFFLVTGCNELSLDPEVPELGLGEGQITGEYLVAFRGTTTFSTDLEGAGAFGLVLKAGDGGFELRVAMDGGGRPAPGVYTIRSPQSGLYAEVAFTPPGTSELQSFESEFGQLSIISSSPGSLHGTLTFRAENQVSNRDIRVSAYFNASCTQTAVASCG